MVANQKIVAAINEQMGNEFSAMLQYYAIAAHFGAEGLLEVFVRPIQRILKVANSPSGLATLVSELLDVFGGEEVLSPGLGGPKPGSPHD